MTIYEGHLLHIDRFVLKPDWTISRLLVQGKPDGFVIEDEIRKVKVPGETCIDAGVYNLGVRLSPKFSKEFYWNDSTQTLITKKQYFQLPEKIRVDWKPHELIWIMHVPKFEYVLIHWGNTDDDTEACLVVGNEIGIINKQGAVLNSRLYYMNLYKRIYPLVKNGKEQIRVTINKNSDWISKAV